MTPVVEVCLEATANLVSIHLLIKDKLTNKCKVSTVCIMLINRAQVCIMLTNRVQGMARNLKPNIPSQLIDRIHFKATCMVKMMTN